MALFPLGELSIQIVNALVISLLPPDLLPKLDFEKGIPKEHATLVVVPMMLTSLEVVHREVEKLEVRYLANRERESLLQPVSRLHGFPGADGFHRCLPARRGARRNRSVELALSARRAIPALPPAAGLVGERAAMDRTGEKARQAGRSQHASGGRAQGKTTRMRVAGSLPLPIRYVITLDADTQLPVTSARRLVETIAHPLNRVEIDPVDAHAQARLHHHSAARQHRPAGSHGDAIHARVCGHQRNRSLLPVRFRRAAGSVRRSDLPRQGDLRRAGVPDHGRAIAFPRKRCSVTT